MESTSLTALADEQLTLARGAANGRSAHTVHGGHDRRLRQTLLALAAGQGLDEHESPGEATLQVLRGRVRVTAGDDAWEGTAGDHLVLPPTRHDLVAIEDAAVLPARSTHLQAAAAVCRGRAKRHACRRTRSRSGAH